MKLAFAIYNNSYYFDTNFDFYIIDKGM